MFPRSGGPADAALRYHAILKTLLVDIDRAMLQRCLARVGTRQHLTVASSKAQALHLLRHGPSFDVIVACERLEDGSGLALLNEIHAKWPHLVRVFCSERQRLTLVQSRLKVLRLGHTLAYPIKPIQLEVMLVLLAHARAKILARARGPGHPEG